MKTLDGQRAIARNGYYLPEREIVTAIGPVPVQAPKVRDRSGSGAKFNSNMVPPYVRKSPRAAAALPWLYLRGVSTGDMSEAFSALLGEQAKGLSPNVVARLKAQWVQEFEQWNKRDLSGSRVEGFVAGTVAGPEGSRAAKAGPLLASGDGTMGRTRGSLSANTASALLVSQDRKCAERLAQIAACGGSGFSRHRFGVKRIPTGV